MAGWCIVAQSLEMIMAISSVLLHQNFVPCIVLEPSFGEFTVV